MSGRPGRHSDHAERMFTERRSSTERPLRYWLTRADDPTDETGCGTALSVRYREYGDGDPMSCHRGWEVAEAALLDMNRDDLADAIRVGMWHGQIEHGVDQEMWELMSAEDRRLLQRALRIAEWWTVAEAIKTEAARA